MIKLYLILLQIYITINMFENFYKFRFLKVLLNIRKFFKNGNQLHTKYLQN